LHRSVDVEDIVTAHLLAIDKVETIGFAKYIISATTPFEKEEVKILNQDARSLVAQKFPNFEEIYQKRGWKMYPKIGRVYDNEKARIELNWRPKYDFHYVLDCLETETDFRSPLSKKMGIKGYHQGKYLDGLYPVNEEV